MIVALAGVMGGAIPVYLASRKNPSRRVSDTAAIVDASGHVIFTLRAELDRLDGELEDTRIEARALRLELEERPTKAELLAHVDRLENQLLRLGETPVNGTIGK